MWLQNIVQSTLFVGMGSTDDVSDVSHEVTLGNIPKNVEVKKVENSAIFKYHFMKFFVDTGNIDTYQLRDKRAADLIGNRKYLIPAIPNNSNYNIIFIIIVGVNYNNYIF